MPSFGAGANEGMTVREVADFTTYMRRRGLAKGTIEKRRMYLSAFGGWLERPLLTATTDEIERFLDSRQVCARTRYCWLSHLHSFYAWAIDHELTDRDPTGRIDRPKLRQLLPRPLGEADLEVALANADRVMSAWLHLAAYAGLRCAEIASLEASDVLESEATLHVTGKGDKERMVPAHPKVLLALRAAGIPRTGPLFRRPRGGRYTAAMVSREISLYFEGLGIAATAHQLRHRFATRALAATGDLRAVQELLGHASPQTTAVYTRVTVNRLRSVVDLIDGAEGEPWQPAML